MNTPDPQQIQDATKHAQESGLSLWQWVGGGSGAVVVGRLIFSAFRRLGWLDGLAASEARLRTELYERNAKIQADADAMEKAKDERIEEIRSAFFASERALIEEQAKRSRAEADVARLTEEVKALRGAWDPDRTLPPRLG